MLGRSAIGKPWGTPVALLAVQKIRESAAIVSQNNGQELFFRGTVRSGGKWGWATTHFDAAKKMWSTPGLLPELIGVTHVDLGRLTGTMIDTHFRNGKLALFKRSRLVSRMVLREYPPVDGLVINLSIGWDGIMVPQYKIDQGSSFQLVTYPWIAGRTMAMWAVSTKLSSTPLLIPAIQHGFLLEVSGWILLGRTGPSTTGLSELSLSIPKNSALAGLRLYFQNVAYNPVTGSGGFSNPVEIEIGK